MSSCSSEAEGKSHIWETERVSSPEQIKAEVFVLTRSVPSLFHHHLGQFVWKEMLW